MGKDRKRLVYYFPLVLPVYFLFAMTRWVAGWEEVYLVGAWGMFQYVFPYYDVYDLEVLSTDQGTLPLPVSLRDPDNSLGHWLDGEGVLAVRALHGLAKSPEELRYLREISKPERASKLLASLQGDFRDTLEGTYLEAGWRYQLVRRRVFTRETREQESYEGDARLGPYTAAPPAELLDFNFRKARKFLRVRRDDDFERNRKRRRRRG